MSEKWTEPPGAPAESGVFHRIVVEDLPARAAAPGARATPGRRLRAVALVALVFVVASAVLAREIIATPRGATDTFPPPGPVVLLSNVAFGTVTLNGTPLKGVPPLLLPLRNGPNVITVAAPPFAPRTCRVTQARPGLVSGDCLLRGIERGAFTIGGRAVHPSAAVVARFTGGDLPPDQYAAARAVVAAQLVAASGAVLDVPPGEPIAAGGTWPKYIASDAAGDGVRATLRYGLFDDGARVQRQNDCGLSLCGETLFTSTVSASYPPIWNVSPDAYFVWSFSDPYGNQLTSLPYPVAPTATLPLIWDAAGGWQPVPQSASAILPPELQGRNLALAAALDPGICGAGFFFLQTNASRTTEFISSLNTGGAPGCAFSLRNGGGQHDGTFIWRFGVLLAADSEARALQPQLPIATAAEVAEASK